MARGKKSRTMKNKLGIKTGSKKDFIKQGEKGKIPSHNRLEKHKKTKQKSAYQQFLEENNQKDTSSGQNTIQQRLNKAEEKAKAAETKPKKVEKEKSRKDFNELTGDELLNLFR
jgi:hypothetical protein